MDRKGHLILQILTNKYDNQFNLNNYFYDFNLFNFDTDKFWGYSVLKFIQFDNWYLEFSIKLILFKLILRK